MLRPTWISGVCCGRPCSLLCADRKQAPPINIYIYML